MKITQEADYALRVILHLSKLGYGEKVEARIISEKEELPLRFLLKLLRKLTKSGIVVSFRGVKGGYALNKQPKDINLKDVIEAIDGPICINRCIYNPEYCNAGKNGNCEIHRALCKIQGKLVSELEAVNFQEILDEKRGIIL
ncbi:Rrf2 family transcriptional regulator [Clostridium sporogenes]|jgi:Rrf2 family protein|uniref:Rrf2 family transcriptional regulator n=2 Tax=Clostridium TaxID=1485 RepID=A0AAU8YZY4_CLOBO|nr:MULTISPECIES: Rrf2 family transcriptional regulator [Clostridium]AJD30486.1 Rrf2 family protein [Clostridium botulinum Prevot_594]AVP59532.1 Rrf2 family transcriptional regulator [Clostridium botulinum]AKC62071.1 putative transcriptional regulator [Clostridium sporogenes]AKJ89359.1 transcriptional regulator [Clostridium sporogenes]AVP65921.1 Rrf2 family transcriptional regulator [Clostridium botulinum]